MPYTKLLLTTALFSSALLCPGIAVAQDADNEEIVVTASRRAQALQDVPYNISAYTGAALEESGVTDFGNLAQLVPGLAFVDTGPAVTGNNNNFILRGLNANQTINGGGVPNGSVAPVSTYLGEAPVFFPMHLTDLERVEVLRGPQGTLYGSGSLGGTLRFIPRRPDLEEFSVAFNGEVSTTEHSGDLSQSGEVILNLPIAENRLALRIVAGIQNLGGFIDAPNLAVLDANGVPVPAVGGDLASGFVFQPVREDINDSTTTYFRTALRADFGNGWEAQLNYAYQNDEVDNPQTINGRFTGGSIDSSLENFPGALFPNPSGVPGGLWPNGATLFPSLTGYRSGALIEQPYEREVNVFNLDISGDLGFATLSSTTSHYTNESRQITDLTGSYLVTIAPGSPNFASFYGYYPRMIIADVGAYQNEGWSQEIRLASDGDNVIDYVVGVYYAEQSADGGDALIIPGLYEFDQNVLPLLGGPFGMNPSVLDTDYTRQRGFDFTDIAIFGEVTWNITPAWQVTAGARHFQQEFDVFYTQTQPFCGPACAEDGLDPLGTTTISGNSNNVEDTIFKLNTSYELSDDLNLYATYAEGFRRGGANGVGTGGIYASLPQFLTYEPDVSTNYEIGLKGSLGDHDFTLAAFYMGWENFQFDDFTPSQLGVVINGSNAHAQGIELELSGRLAEGLTYSLGYSYTEAEIDDDFSVADLPPYALLTAAPPQVSIAGFSGDRLPGVPEHSLSVAANYTTPLGFGDWDITYHVNGSYRGSTASAFNPTTQFGKTYYEIESFSIWDAALTLDSNAQWAATLFVNNIGDELGSTGGLPAPIMGANQQYQFVTRPRTVGLRVSYDFN